MLIPVLLGGCSLPHNRPADSDARQFVDGQITTQLQRIAEAQKNLQLASQTATPKASPPITNSKPVLPTDTLRGLPAIKSQGTPEPYSIVSVNARNLRLEAMLRTIIPPGWTPVISADLKRKFTSTLSITANDQWPYVLNRLLQQNGWVALIDWPQKQVFVAYRGPGFSATSSGVSSQSGTEASAIPKVAPAPAPKIWRIDAGSTLKDTLFNWAAAEKCAAPGVNTWTVAWLTPVNYRIDAPLQFKGDFRSVLNSLFTLYGSAQVPLYAGIRSAQCVVSVDDKEIH